MKNSTLQLSVQNQMNALVQMDTTQSLGLFLKCSHIVQKSIFVFVTLLLCTLSALTQGTITQYLDQNRNVQKGSEGAWFRRTNEVDMAKLYHVEIYLLSSEALVMTGTYSDSDMQTEEGTFAYFFDNGTHESGGEYSDGTKIGNWKRWDWQGVSKVDRLYPCCPSNN